MAGVSAQLRAYATAFPRSLASSVSLSFSEKKRLIVPRIVGLTSAVQIVGTSCSDLSSRGALWTLYSYPVMARPCRERLHTTNIQKPSVRPRAQTASKASRAHLVSSAYRLVHLLRFCPCHWDRIENSAMSGST